MLKQNDVVVSSRSSIFVLKGPNFFSAFYGLCTILSCGLMIINKIKLQNSTSVVYPIVIHIRVHCANRTLTSGLSLYSAPPSVSSH